VLAACNDGTMSRNSTIDASSAHGSLSGRKATGAGGTLNRPHD
jgi:hypothetical protein